MRVEHDKFEANKNSKARFFVGYFHTLFNCHLESLLFPSQKIDTEVKNDMTSLSRKKDYCNVTSLAYPRLKKLSEVTTKIEVLSSTETMFSTI